MPVNYDTNDKQLEAELVRDEGEVLHVYSDSKDDRDTLDHLKGYLTIGVGILIDSRRGGGITQEESRYLLRNRIASKMADLDKHLPWWRQLSDARQRVLINMCFNLGINGLIGFVHTLESIRTGQYEIAAQQMLESEWARQVGDRAKRLAAMMRQG